MLDFVPIFLQIKGKFPGPPIVGPPFPYYSHTTLLGKWVPLLVVLGERHKKGGDYRPYGVFLFLTFWSVGKPETKQTSSHSSEREC